MKWKSFLIAGTSCFLASLLVIFAVSCGYKSPTATCEQQDQTIPFALLNNSFNKVTTLLDISISETSVEMIPAESGGEILFPKFGNNTGLFIPPYSLPKKTKISATAELLRVLGKNVIRFDFGPDQLIFESPAILTVDGKHFTGSGDISLFWLNPDTGFWQLQARGTIENGVGSFEIDHFSKYAISD